ncbi:MFS transporter [Desulfovibrio sp. OttesenSCG-928-A18]|nr:MFS transporter [Desulfovibrio sp. OttesenSCG-928-A18]
MNSEQQQPALSDHEEAHAPARPELTATGAGRITLLGMSSCYALGTFADNFYKQAAVLIAATCQMTTVQSLATVLFSLPFILFSAWSGWLADRVSKKSIVVAAKSLELFAMLAGAYMLLSLNWPGILLVMFLMASQSAVFSPAINGSIPELFPASQVPRVNSLIKLASTAAILAGMALAGVFIDMRPQVFDSLRDSFPPAQPSAFFSFIYPDKKGAGQPATERTMPPMPYLPAPVSDSTPQSSEATAAEDNAQARAIYAEFPGRASAALFLIFVSCAGLATAFSLRKRPAADKGDKARPFPWTGPLDSLRHSLACRKDPALCLVLLADAWFYGIAVVAVLSIVNMATELGYSKSMNGLMTALLMTGVAFGALLAGRTNAESWKRLLVPSALGISITLALCGLAPLIPTALNLQLVWIFICLLSCGICGGIYLIPLESFIQVRPAAPEKGKIIAVSNFMSFSAMALFGAAFQFISLLPPALTFVLYGAGTLLFTCLVSAKKLYALEKRSLADAALSPLGSCMQSLLSLRYRVQERGLDLLPLQAPPLDREHARHKPGQTAGKKKAAPDPGPEKSAPGILFLPNHPALIDPVLVYSRLAGLRPRPLADERHMRGLLQGLARRVAGIITIPDMQKDGRKGADGIRLAIAALAAKLKAGENILLYPSGRMYRSDKERIGANSAVQRLLDEVPDARVVLVRSSGLWGSSFSHAGGKEPFFIPRMLRGLLLLLANGIFFMPRRHVVMEFVETDELPRDGDKNRLNRFLEAFYNEKAAPPVFVPRFFWSGSKRDDG